MWHMCKYYRIELQLLNHTYFETWNILKTWNKKHFFFYFTEKNVFLTLFEWFSSETIKIDKEMIKNCQNTTNISPI